MRGVARARTRLLGFVLSALTLLGVTTPPASAVFPGRNGGLLVAGTQASPPCVGSRLVGCSSEPVNELPEYDALFMVSLQTKVVRRIASLNSLEPNSDFAWGDFSPDGSMAVIGIDAEFGPLYTISLVPGSRLRRLPVSGSNPVWSPATSAIAYSSPPQDFPSPVDGSLRAFALPTGPDRALTRFRGTTPDLGDWSLAGGLVMEHDARAWLLSRRGAQIRKTGIAGYHFRWSPNGSRLVFTRRGAVTVSCPNGNRYRQITTFGSAGSQPLWSPDGRQLLVNFSAYQRNDVYALPVDTERPLPRSAWRQVVVNGQALDWQPLPPAPVSPHTPVCTERP